MSEFDDIVAGYGERPDVDGADNSDFAQRVSQWSEGTEDSEACPTPLHQTMLPGSLLGEMRNSPLFAELIPPEAAEVPALMMTQMIYTGMALAALSFEGDDPVEGLDEIASMFNMLGELLKIDPRIRYMVRTGRMVVEADRDRREHNERLGNEHE